jgi:hypothetical protein
MGTASRTPLPLSYSPHRRRPVVPVPAQVAAEEDEEAAQVEGQLGPKK